MGNTDKILSVDEEAKLIKPIDDYISSIQKQIDDLNRDYQLLKIVSKEPHFST